MAKKKAAGSKKSLDPKGQLPKGKLALTKDPRVYAERIPIISSPYKRVLGLDLASNCGASFCDIIPGMPIKEAPIIGGQWDLSVGNHDTNSLRYIRLKQFLTITEPDLIFYEEVKITPAQPPGGVKMNLTALVARAVSGAQVVQGLCAIMTVWAEERGIPCEAIPIGTLKKYATGKGNANKEEMVVAANEEFGTSFEPATYESTGCDNIADSMFLCKMAVDNYSEGMT